MGWLKDATAGAKNGSILVPFLISRLPQLPFSEIVSNQEGTYAFDLHAEVRSILSSHKGTKPIFAVAHLVYLHDEAYPSFADLSSLERAALFLAPVHTIRDLSGDWQLPSTPDDRIGLNAWKVENVQAVITDEIRKTGFLDPQNHNRLILLSDHGDRWRLANDHFASPGYYSVPLITFGLPVRDVDRPISLLDVSSLAGLPDSSWTGPAAPVVEYSNLTTTEEFKQAVLEADWKLDGEINLGPEVIQKCQAILKAYDPYSPGKTEVAQQQELTQQR